MGNLILHDIRYNLCKFGLLILFFQSLYLRFTWGQLNNAIILTIAFSFCLIYAIYTPRAFSLKRVYLIPLILFATAQFYSIIGTSFFSLIKSIIHILIVGFVLFLNDEHKKELLKYFTIGVALILFVSLIGWILLLVGVHLPHNIIHHPDLSYEFDNYYLFLKSSYRYFPRFQSFFLEPGILGMVTAFLLYANRFDLKRKEVVIILIATIFSFSLASYILTTFSAFVFIILNIKRKVLILVVSSVLLLLGYLFFLNLNKGNNAINRLIISRLEVKKSNIIDYNRFSTDFNGFYTRLKGKDLIFGIGSKKYNKIKWEAGNAGYKVFIVQYGILGAVLVLLFYFSLVLINKSNLLLFLLVVYILCFVQAAYPLWLGIVLIFMTSMPNLKRVKVNIINE